MVSKKGRKEFSTLERSAPVPPSATPHIDAYSRRVHFSGRPLRAMRLKAGGYDTKAIAKIMGISARAAREHLAEGNRRLAADRSAQ